jgi:hypothetical protein
VLFLCLLGLIVAVPLVVMSLQVLSPLAYDYGEGIVLFQARHITDLHVAYRHIETPPYVVFHYPPVYYLLVRLADRFVGNTLLSGRLTSVLCTLGMLLAIGVLVYRAIPARWSRPDRLVFALIASFLPLQLDAMRWAAFMRVDMASLLFSYAGLAIFILGGTRLRPQMVAVLLFVLAFYTKQSTLAGALACLAAAAILSLRRAVTLALFAAALVVALGVAGNAVTQGGFLTNLFGYNLNPFSPMRAVAGFAQCLTSLGLVLPLALVVLWTQLARFRGLSLRSSLARLRASLAHVSMRRSLVVLSIHFALTFGTVVAYGKIGSSANYYLDFQICACVLAAFMLFTLYARPQLPARLLNLPHSLAPAIAISLGLAVGALLVAGRVVSVYRSAETPARIGEAARVVREIRAAGGPVWSDNMTLLVQAGKDVVAEPAIVSVLARTGRWDENGLLRMLRQGKLALIVVHQDLDSDNFYSPGVRREILEGYSLADRIGEYSLYRPKTR